MKKVRVRTSLKPKKRETHHFLDGDHQLKMNTNIISNLLSLLSETQSLLRIRVYIWNALINGEESERFPRIESWGDKVGILCFLILRLGIIFIIADDLVFLGKNIKYKGPNGYSWARWGIFWLTFIFK